MKIKPVNLKRNQNIKFVLKGKPCFGTVLHSTKSKTTIYHHEGTASKGYVATLISKTPQLTVEEVTESAINPKHRDIVKKITSIKKGDLVKVWDKELGDFVGKLDSITTKGYTISNANRSYIFPFSYMIEKTDSLVEEKPMPLDNWTAKKGRSNIEYHDGGACQMWILYHDNKKVLEVTEDAWSGPYDFRNIALVGDKQAHDALTSDAKKSFEIAGIPESRHFYAESADCIGQWLLKRELVSLKDNFSD